MTKSQKTVYQKLDQLRKNLPLNPTVEIQDLKIIAFSDHHRGQNDHADDFRMCKAAYHAALGYYLTAGYSLYLLGDVEELWECRPRNVINTYRDTLDLEKQFAVQERYQRIWGNHDDHWRYPGEVNRLLGDFISAQEHSSSVPEAHAITVTDNSEPIGEILFVHGHQGTLESDRFSWLSRYLVRYIWRPLQRLTKIKPPTPARDFNLRLEQEIALHGWANMRKGLVLISGHTHHTVFMSVSHEQALEREIESLKTKLEKIKNPVEKNKVLEAVSEKSAQLNWVLAKSNGIAFHIAEDKKPCYFNTGCCSFADGDITGIEIENGFIRLVRWPDDDGKPRKKILRENPLREVFAQCQ